MNLDDLELFKQVDTQNMLGHIDALPDQLEQAWALSKKYDLPAGQPYRQIVICGMGGSAISGDLLRTLIADSCPLPVVVIRDYDLPAFVNKDSLVIALSHSGNTEETLAATEQALARHVPVAAVTTGGKLADMVEAGGGTVWRFESTAQPRATLGLLYGLLLGLINRLDIVPDLADEVADALDVMRKHQSHWGVDTIAPRNPAKRYAGQLVDCIPVIWGAGLMAPVARRWKTQLNENAKTSACYEELPELNHNTVVGIVAPDELITRHKFQIIQITSSYDHPRVALRHRLTHEMLLTQAIITDPVKGRGQSRLAQQMSMVLFGDYISYYVAMAYQIDPTPIGPIMLLKEALEKETP